MVASQLDSAPSIIENWSFKFCTFDYAYKWATILILIVQIAAIGVGTIAPTFSWFVVIQYRRPNVRNKSCKERSQVEGYWTDNLVLIQESPIVFGIRNYRCVKLDHDAKLHLLCFCVKLQKGKLIQYPLCVGPWHFVVTTRS